MLRNANVSAIATDEFFGELDISRDSGPQSHPFKSLCPCLWGTLWRNFGTLKNFKKILDMEFPQLSYLSIDMCLGTHSNDESRAYNQSIVSSIT
jgi:hypothetical protein